MLLKVGVVLLLLNVYAGAGDDQQNRHERWEEDKEDADQTDVDRQRVTDCEHHIGDNSAPLRCCDLSLGWP